MIRSIKGHQIKLLFSKSRNKSKKIRKKSLIKNLEDNFSKSSFSHTFNVSLSAHSLSNKNIGVDIEPLNRKISTKLNLLLQTKSERLDIKNIELWCLMEATFKASPRLQNINFLKYDFERYGEIFQLKKDFKYNIYSKLYKRKGDVLALAIEI